MNQADLKKVTDDLEAVFSLIEQQRMADIPILNSALQVKAVGFISWNEGCFGVLITPWFMNLMLLGVDDGKDHKARWPGEKVSHVFPSGAYEFIVGEEPGIGLYQACSLFSPMLQFHTQALAEETAAAVMDGIMQSENRTEISTCSREIEQAWYGETGAAQAETAESDELGKDSPSLSERLDTPLSRRELLTGLFAEKSE
ncbi:MAG: [NiFe]-hydrogenase assembly chaperone HybE [Sedimenticola sp.]|nr:[NiFe]-hydrogenase assembly chaperone HybE [Sedimenticola sp.]